MAVVPNRMSCGLRLSRPVPALCLAMGGVGLFVLGVLRSRILGHKSTASWMQVDCDALVGTSGQMHEILTFLLGMSVFAVVWMFLLGVVLLDRRSPDLRSGILHVTGILAPFAWLTVPGVLLLLSGAHGLRGGLVIAGAIVVWVVSRTVRRLGDVETAVASRGPSIRDVRRTLSGFLLLTPLVGGMAFLAHSARHTDAIDNGILPKAAYVLSFDTEEDWCPQEDAARRGDANPGSDYMDSYKYIASGMLEKLASGLTDRSIPATFYCTPNLAADHPDVLKRIEDLGHEVGVHLHMHNYPSFCVNGDDELSSYPPDTQLAAIMQARRDIEAVLGHSVYTFRSGQWSCDCGVERACVQAGFQSISNHESTYLLPSGMWQVASAKNGDVLVEPRLLWVALRRARVPRVIPLFSHPMVLFDHALDCPREDRLDTFFRELDRLRRLNPNLPFMTTSAAVSLLRYEQPSARTRGIVTAASLGLIALCVSTATAGLRGGRIQPVEGCEELPQR
ncbi:polysaccharide deacetylase family protein [Anaerobaca lacustris]|uniref:Polysaccharide deacetylase family protein n=1 Tax=Anaerobaca lacustris TaxID=3044600 RepID=A0AAW6TVY2_9BACT|nr:polysaccharide deacetylase family protein [Sedimentisphaerales bacterium M17dextr]